MGLFSFGDKSKSADAPVATSTKKRILLCEDDKFFSQALTLILGSAGYEIIAAPDGQQGLDLLKQQGNFQMILCDIMMPVLDGFGVLKALKADPQYSGFTGIPFIFLTGVSDFSSMDRATELGAKDYFIKANTGLPKIVDMVKKYID